MVWAKGGAGNQSGDGPSSPEMRLCLRTSGEVEVRALDPQDQVEDAVPAKLSESGRNGEECLGVQVR